MNESDDSETSNLLSVLLLVLLAVGFALVVMLFGNNIEGFWSCTKCPTRPYGQAGEEYCW